MCSSPRPRGDFRTFPLSLPPAPDCQADVSKTAASLNELIAVLNDGVEFFGEAAVRTEHPEYRDLFGRLAATKQAIAEHLRAAGREVEFHAFPSIQGHDSFLIDLARFEPAIRNFLKSI